MPELSRDVDIQSLLIHRPPDWARVIAIRCALRGFAHVFIRPRPPYHRKSNFDFNIGGARAIFIAWAHLAYPQVDFTKFAKMAHDAIEFSDSDEDILARQAAKAVFLPTDVLVRADIALTKFENIFNFSRGLEWEGARSGLESLRKFAEAGSFYNVRREYFIMDYNYLCDNGVRGLLSQPLWMSGGSPRLSLHKDQVSKIWNVFLSDSDHNGRIGADWKIWCDWHEAVVPIKSVVPHSAFGQAADVEIATQPNEFWERDSDLVMADIASIVRRYSRANEPEIGPQEGGFIFVARDGALARMPSLPEVGETGDSTQEILFARLKSRLGLFRRSMQNMLAQYPTLADVVADYADVVAVDQVADTDVDRLWICGVGLISQAQAFGLLDEARQVTQPLEPEQQALLGEIARLHGAFIMGFPAGRELVERSQIPLLISENSRALVKYEHAIVKGLLESAELALSDSAKKLFLSLDHVLASGGERIESTAIAVYPAIRNILIFTAKALSSAVALASGVGLIGVPVDLAVQGLGLFVIENLSDILGFAGNVPELRAYFEFHLTRLGIDYRGRALKEHG